MTAIMIFVSGVHGVGKSHFCDMVRKKININTYSASTLIANKKQSDFSKDKHISDIDKNQQILIKAVEELNATNHKFIIDGHFCLLDANGKITRVPYSTFSSLNPEAILLLTENPEIIAIRRKKRDGVIVSPKSIEQFQKAECAYAVEVSNSIQSKLFISNGSEDLTQALDFIKLL